MPYDSRVRDIVKIGDALFARPGLMTLFQNIAENFYPERADFIGNRSLGEEFASGLFTSYPPMLRRELANLFAAFQRPRAVSWFELHAKDKERDKDRAARQWMEWAQKVQWQAMYDPASQFVRATKEGDHDFAAFGQAVLSVELDYETMTLLYRTWHLRDCAWAESNAGKIDTMHRRWKAPVRTLVRLFKDKVHENVAKLKDKEPEKQIDCRHIIVPAADYDMKTPKARTMGFVSLYIDEENEQLLEEKPMGWFQYIVPRWQTVSGSQYARSPATEIALPDGRLLQDITRVLLEAGEKGVDQPMVAVGAALRSDVNLMAGGITVVDIDYDQRTGPPLQPAQDISKGLPFGVDMAQAIQEQLKQAFYLNKLGLPEVQMKTMTAYEVRKIIEDHVRQSAPIFEPVEQEYNSPLCNLTFEILQNGGAFGPAAQLPEALLGGQAVEFTFLSPLRDVEDQMKAQQFIEGLNLIDAARNFDPAQGANVEITEAVQDALRGIKWPAKWIADPKKVEAARAAAAEANQMVDTAAAIDAGAGIAAKGGDAMKKIMEAQKLAQSAA